MAARQDVIAPVLVGRSAELGIVSGFLDRAAAGVAGGMLVSGDPGVGKTALVQHACTTLAKPDALILTGACLPLTSLTVPFLALRSALRGAFPRESAAGFRLSTSEDSLSHVPVAFDAWLDELCRQRPVILVIDDLQWADQSTLDVLMYLLAGPPDRPLAVIATIRGTEIGDDHPLQRWLADIRRLPRIDRMSLAALDRIATAAQLAGVLGAPPHESLVCRERRNILVPPSFELAGA